MAPALGALRGQIKSQDAFSQDRKQTVTDQNRGEEGQPRALDLGNVWNRGLTLLRENAQLIAIVAGVFVLLPNAALQFALPADADMEQPLQALVNTNASDAMRQKAALALGEMLKPFFLLSAASLVFAHIGYAAIVALIGRARPTVGEGLAQALRVVLPLMLALIITFVGAYAVLLLIQLVLMPLGPAAGVFLGSIIGLLTFFYITARLALTLPVMVVEWQLNPLKALIRSWRLTAGNARVVFGFWMLMGVAWFVTMILQASFAGGLASVAGTGPTASLIQGLIGGAFSMVWGALYCAMGVSMHTALRGPIAEDVASQFD